MRAPNLGFALIALVLGLGSTPAWAGWKLVPGQKVAAVDGVQITPTTDWNQSGTRPGKLGRAWTKDGDALNAFEVFSGIPHGAPVYREANKKANPMPKFDKGILLPELADFFERSFRARNRLTDFQQIKAEPGLLGGHKALVVRYQFINQNDELIRMGEARLAVVRGKLYVTNFHAPSLHYFDDRIGEVRTMMDNAKF